MHRLKMVAAKDFYWEKTPDKGWQARNCPLGEGMVDWKYFFKAIGRAGFQGPISLHLEYDVPGSTKAAKERSEEHTSELQSRLHLVCRLLLEKKKQARAPRSIQARTTYTDDRSRQRPQRTLR